MVERLALPLSAPFSDVVVAATNVDRRARVPGPQGSIVPRRSLEPKPELKCRLMTAHDIDAAVTLLSAGFPERSPSYWRRALQRLRDRSLPEGLPRYGYVLAEKHCLVGIILTIFANTDSGSVRGNVSSWYVEPEFRSFSNILLAAPLKLENVTLVNISPAPNTLETIHAQGFSEYVVGTFQAVAAISAPVAGAKIHRIKSGMRSDNLILSDHAGWNCLSFEVVFQGTRYPFVFAPTKFMAGRVPCAQLLYCQDMDDFRRFAGPLGRRLLRHGFLAILVDSDGPIKGLPGLYRPGRVSRLYSGVARPRIGDLAYTELAIFGA